MILGILFSEIPQAKRLAGLLWGVGGRGGSKFGSCESSLVALQFPSFRLVRRLVQAFFFFCKSAWFASGFLGPRMHPIL